LKTILYFLISILATTLGSIAGFGGGIIIKPVLDVLGDYSVQTIGILSSITVLAMSAASAGKQLLQKTRFDIKTLLPLAIGAAIGGVFGQKLLVAVVNAYEIGSAVIIIQNATLLVFVIAVLLYMLNRKKIKSRNLSGIWASVFVGFSLGLVSSFLGIGGGPINVALMVYLFSFDIKTATVCSIITILFSQLANIGLTTFMVGFGRYDLKMLPLMVIGAIAGGFIGAHLNKRLDEKTVEKCFIGVQFLVIGFAVFNVFRNTL